MTLYLARKVGADYTVDETSTVYIGRCDDDDCLYMVDHARVEIVNDALRGHSERAHPETTGYAPGWLTFTSSGSVAPSLSRTHPVAVANDARLRAPSPAPRGEASP